MKRKLLLMSTLCECLLKRGLLASVGCSDLDRLCDSWRNAVYRDGCGNTLRLDTHSIQNNRKGYKGCTCNIIILIIFIQQLPTWRNLND